MGGAKCWPLCSVEYEKKHFGEATTFTNVPVSALCGGLEEFGPMRQVIQRRGVGVIELEGGDGNGAVADGGHVGVRVDAFDLLLFVQPIIAAAARIGAGLELSLIHI